MTQEFGDAYDSLRGWATTDSGKGAVGNASWQPPQGDVTPMTPTGVVISQSVAIFGCNSTDLAGAYVNGTSLLGSVDGAKTFVGLDSGRNPDSNADNGTDVRTEDRMTESYLITATSSPTVDINAAAAAAQSTLEQSTYTADKGDKVVLTEKPQ